MIESPEDLIQIITACLTLDPKQRPVASSLLGYAFLKNTVTQRDLFVQFKEGFKNGIFLFKKLLNKEKELSRFLI